MDTNLVVKGSECAVVPPHVIAASVTFFLNSKLIVLICGACELERRLDFEVAIFLPFVFFPCRLCCPWFLQSGYV